MSFLGRFLNNDNRTRYGQPASDELDDELNSYYQDDLEDEDVVYTRNVGQNICIVCENRPVYSKNGKTYPTCGLTCAGVLEKVKADTLPQALYNARQMSYNPGMPMPRSPGRGAPGSRRVGNPAGAVTIQAPTINAPQRQPIVTLQLCVVCVTKPCHNTQFVTCGLTCAEKLVTSGAHDKTKCDYCHRRPKVAGKNQCGATCAQKAKLACLLCKTRPKLHGYHLCGKSCKTVATKSTPLLLEAPEGHVTFDSVVKKFQSAWHWGGAPTIKKVYKIIENKTFLQPYDAYKKSHGNQEVYRYHGTKKQCTLGAAGNNTLCNTSGCAVCSILRTSFKVSLASPSGCFGAGVYSSSAANKAYGYTGGSGIMILTKVVLGTPYNVTSGSVRSCPSGYDSVVYDQNGSANETIVYTDDAIRPVFLIIL